MAVVTNDPILRQREADLAYRALWALVDDMSMQAQVTDLMVQRWTSKVDEVREHFVKALGDPYE